MDLVLKGFVVFHHSLADDGLMILRADQPEFEILGDVRTLQVGRERFDVFEFRGDLTDYRRALALTDSWDAAVLDRFPKGWREMADTELLALFESEWEGERPQP